MRDIFPSKITRLPEEDFDERKFLKPGDLVYYFLDFTVRSNFRDNEVVNFLGNYKRCPGKYPTGTPARKYKELAIQIASAALSKKATHKFTWVPIPPSKPPEHPEHDDRVLRTLLGVKPPCDVRVAIRQVAPREAQHTSDTHREPERLKAMWEVNHAELKEPTKDFVVLFDDVITSGCTFRAAKEVLQAAGVASPIVGLFLARAVYPRPDVDPEFDLSDYF